MDVNFALSQLIVNDTSFPALKLAWDTQIDVKEVGELPKITPSHYLKENQYSTEQRFQLLCRQQRKISFRKPGVEVVVEPAVIVFQTYKCGDSLSIPITIRNISKMMQKVTVLMDETFVFKFDKSSQRVAKFPTGMSMSATINFTPEDDRDYYHKLVITTNKTRFAIPIIGIGGRGLLNAPDSVIFEKVPVKYFKTKQIPVCNMGTKPGRFTLSTTGPFCVKPEKGIVAPLQTFSMEVSCYSETVGEFEGHLLMKYENGEEVYVYLKADIINEDIKVTPTEVRCYETYLGMKTKCMCCIENNSDAVLDFKWKKGAEIESASSSDYELDGYDFHSGGDTLDRAIDLLQHCVDGTDCLGIAMGLEEQMSKGPEHLFTHEIFMIEPLTGQLQPHCSTTVYAIFSPQEPIDYATTAYLDITGIEGRLPVEILGKGIGPKFNFGFEVMELGTIFLGGGHSYEIPVLNTSEIRGRVDYGGIVGTSLSTNQAGIEVKVEPHKINLEPNEHGAFYVSFQCTGKPGEFHEEIKFIVPQTNVTNYVTIKGTVSFPSLHFTGHEVFLGKVSYGFPKAVQVTLINDSLNFVDVSLEIDEDGKDPPIDYNKIIESFKNENFEFDSDPAEFTIEPKFFALAPRGMQKITLTMCANQVREIKKKLICYIADKSGTQIEAAAMLPISGFSIVPVLTNESPDINLSECYMQYPYPTEFLVKNSTDLPACYCIVPQGSAKVNIQSDALVGIAKPRQVTSIPFKMTCVHVGSAVAHFDLYTVGNDDKLFTYNVKVDCIPSKLESTTKMIDFGNTHVLESFTQTFEIINSSPLTVPYVAVVREAGGNGDTWDIKPEISVINPFSNVEIGVTVRLMEAGPHTAILNIQMTEALAFLNIRMKANGVGPSISFKPILEKKDVIDFGPMFTKNVRTFTYEIFNMGHLPKVLEWRHVKDPVPDNVFPNENKKKKFSHPDAEAKPATDYYLRKMSFSISPSKKIIHPKSSVILTFSASSNSSAKADEDVILWTYTPMKHSEDDNHSSQLSRRSVGLDELKIYHHSFKPIVSREVKLLAIYEAPKLRFSPSSVLFKIEVTPTDNAFEQQEIIKLENMGYLPISIHFKTYFPFTISLGHQEDQRVEEWSYHFDAHEMIQLTINFDGRHLRKDKGSVFFDSKLEALYEGHPGGETITLRGEVYFPSLTVNQQIIDFGTIVNGTEAVEEFEVHNQGPYCLAYKWFIKPNTTVINIANENNVDGQEKGDLGPLDLQQSVAKSLQGESTTFALLTSEFNLFKENWNANVAELPEDEDAGSNASLYSAQVQSIHSDEIFGKSSSGMSLDEYGDSIQFLRGKMHRSRVLEMIGLHDPSAENEDETNYLSHNRDTYKTTGSISINEIIDIIPMAGVISAGHSQTFTVVFYGHPDITFKTTAFCFIEGGTGKPITIQGASTHASVAVLPRSFDLGTMLFSDVVSKKVTVKNIARVPMEVNLSQTSGKITDITNHVGSLEITPMKSNIPAGGTATFLVSYIPGTIGKFTSGLWVKARYCGAIKIGIEGLSLYPMLSLLLPRNLDCLPLLFVYHEIAKLVDRFHHKDEVSENRGTAIYLDTASDMPSLESVYPALLSGQISRIPSVPQPPDNSFQEVFTPKDTTIPNDTPVQENPDQQTDAKTSDDATVDDFELDMSDWEFVLTDEVPSVYVISDAIERELVTNYVNKLYCNTATSLMNIQRDTKQHVLHRFRNLRLDLPEYVMDLGDVVGGQEVLFHLDIGNPGYIQSTCHIVDGISHKLKKKGIIFSPEEIKHISRGELASFTLKVLLPIPKEMTLEKTMEIIDERIYLQVKSGPRIPVSIKGKVFYPNLSASADTIDFGTLGYNMFKTITFEISNVSLIPIDWNSSTENEQRRNNNPLQSLQTKGRRPPKPVTRLITYDEEAFQIWPRSGTIFPGQKELLQVSFTPPEPGKYSQTMHVKIGNTPFVQVKLQGVLEESSIKVTPETVDFGHILPYNITSSPEITVFNPSDYPIEVYLVENDRKHLKEERIKRFLLRYYGSNKLSSPYLCPGKRFPKVFKQCFKRLIELFKKYLVLRNSKLMDKKSEKARKRSEQLKIEKQARAERRRQKKLQRLIENAEPYTSSGERSEFKESPPLKGKIEYAVLKDMRIKDKKMPKKRNNFKNGKRQTSNKSADRIEGADPKNKDNTGLPKSPENVLTVETPNELVDSPPKSEDKQKILKISKLPRGYITRERVLLEFLKKLKKKGKRSEEFDMYELIGNPIEKAYADVKCDANQVQDGIKKMKERSMVHRSQTHQYIVAKKRPHKIPKTLTNFRLQLVDRRLQTKGGSNTSVQQARLSITPATKPQTSNIPIESVTDLKKGQKKTNSSKKLGDEKISKVELQSSNKTENREKTTKNKSEELSDNLDSKSKTTSEIKIKQKTKTASRTKKVADGIVNDINTPVKEKTKKTKNKIKSDGERSVVVEEEKPKEEPEPISDQKALTKNLTRKQKEKLKLKEALGPTRWIIKPKEKITLKIDFQASELGEYNKTLTFELGRTHLIPAERKITDRQPLGLNNVPISATVNLKGVCALPAVSNAPEVIFPKIVDSIEENEPLHRVYVREDDCFDFGPIVVPVRQAFPSGPTKTVSSTSEVFNHKIKHKENVSNFLVKNTSPLPAVCTLSLVHERRKYFEFKPSHFTVQPGEEQKVTLWAYPRVPDVVVEDHLVFCIKDNPDPIFFRIRVMGSHPQISMDEDILDFGRCLLNSRSVAQVTVENTGFIPVIWQLSKGTPLPQQVYAEKTHGVLNPKESASIRFLFKSGRPIVIADHVIDLEFKDTQGVLGVIDIFKIAMYGEAYDVLVDIASEKEDFTLINLGTLPVGFPIIENLIMTNRGYYDVYFKFIIEPNNLSAKHKHFAKYLKDYLIVQPLEDSLAASEASIVQVIFEPPMPLEFVNEHVLKCQIVDLNMNVLVAELLIPLSVKAEERASSSDDTEDD